MTTHDNSNPIACDQCGKIFNTTHQLKTHVRVMHVGFRFYCDHCPAKFVYKSQLASHCIREHNMQRYESFLWVNDLNSFQFREHECEKCGQRFIQKGHFNRHMKLYHSQSINETSIEPLAPTSDQDNIYGAQKSFQKRRPRGPNKGAFKHAYIPNGMANSENPYNGMVTYSTGLPANSTNRITRPDEF